MTIYIVRHAEPNYLIDGLTRKGKREAKLLSKRLSKIQCAGYYVSPLGRARKTASYTLKSIGKKAETLKWLREFEGKVIMPDGNKTICWDRLPSLWTADERYYTSDWINTELMQSYNVPEEYKMVCDGVDKLLEKYGLYHDGKIFRVEKESHDTIMLFCHFGVEAVILSHIIGISPMVFFHNFVALPSSVTVLTTEEREQGVASFRISAFGDTSHLYAGSEKLSFMARFCECFSDDTRH